MPKLSGLLRFLLRISRDIDQGRRSFVAIVGLGILSGLCNTGLIALINARLQRAGDGAGWLLWAFVALCLLMPLARFLSNVLLVVLTQRSVFTLRMQLGRQILQAPMRQLEAVGPHRLLATLTDDVTVITTALANLPLLLMHGTIVLGCLTYLAWLSPRGLALVLVFLLVGVLSYQWPMLHAGRRFDAARTEWNAVMKGLRGLIEGIKELKLHWRRRRDFLKQGLEEPTERLQRGLLTANVWATAAASWGQILFFLLVGAILFAAPAIGIESRYVLTGYALTILYMITPLEVVLNQMPHYRRAQTAVRHVEELGLSLLEGEGREVEALGEPPAAWKRLELRGVTHTYGGGGTDSAFTLGPVDLAFEPGELVFVVGGNGSGKTTLAKLLVGLYRPDAGEVALDGRRIDESGQDRYRQMFSVVFNDFFLFEELIGLRAPNGDETATAYLERLKLDHAVRVDGGKLSTILLSQGQRRRLALLTAFLEDRPIYLFDEWAADQDPLFRDLFYRELLPELQGRGKTVLVITHDDRYYGLADRLIKLDYGRVVEDRRQAAAPVRTAAGGGAAWGPGGSGGLAAAAKGEGR